MQISFILKGDGLKKRFIYVKFYLLGAGGIKRKRPLDIQRPEKFSLNQTKPKKRKGVQNLYLFSVYLKFYIFAR